MSDTLNRVLVHKILQHAEDFPWRMQDLGLMGLRLDDGESTDCTFGIRAIWSTSLPFTTIHMFSRQRSWPVS
jgi:hypothetical protein